MQYLKNEVRDEFNFLHADKHETILQVGTIILVGMARPAQTTQNNKFAKSFQYLKKEVRDEVDFFVQMSITVIYKLILSFLMGVSRHA